MPETRPPLALIVRGREPVEVVAYACGTCGYVARTEADAIECCTPYDCSGGCGARLPKKDHRTKCAACMDRDYAAREQAKYDAARKVPLAEYQQEGLFVDDRWFRDLEELEDHYADEPEDRPAWAWGCTPRAFELDADDLLSNALEEHYDEAGDNISDAERKRLQAFLNEWAKAQGITSYECDESTVVLLPPPEAEADRA